MKRFVGYLMICISVLIAVFVGFVPTFNGVNASSDYSSGREFIYEVSVRDLDTNYSYINDQVSKSNEDLGTEIEDIVEEFKDRLDIAGVSNPVVEAISQDSNSAQNQTSYQIRVSYKAQYEQLYDVIDSYLRFDSDISVTIITSSEDQISNFPEYSSSGTTSESAQQLFDFSDVTIDSSTGAPRLRIALSNPTFFYESIYQTVVDNTPETSTDEESEEEATTPNEAYIYVVNHWRDNYDISEVVNNSSTYYTDAVSNVLYRLDTSNPAGLFEDYSSDNTSEEGYPAIYVDYSQFIPDLTGLSDNAVTQRIIYKVVELERQKLLSTSYDYDIKLLNQTYASTSVSNGRTEAFVENIKQYGTLAFSTLVIATIIGFVLVALFLSLSHGVLSLLALAVGSGATILSALFLSTFGVEFNVGAILGLIITAVIALFGSLVYFRKVKESCYSGKNLKKANSEASKKTIMYQVDIGIIGLIVGITSYLFENSILASFGAVMILGSLFSFLLNAFLVRICYWLLANSSFINDHLKLLSIDKKLIPDLSKDEKSTYFESYKEQGKKENKKGKLITTIVTSVLLIGSLVAIPVVNAVNGSIYGGSTSSYAGNQINIRYNIEATDENIDGFATVTELQTELLDNIRLLSGDSISENDPELNYDNDISVYYYSEITPNSTANGYYYFNYVITLNEEYSENDTFYLANDVTIQGGLTDVIATGIRNGDFTSTNNSMTVYYGEITNYTDDYLNLQVLYLALIVAAIATVYVGVRYGLGKAWISLLAVGIPATITIGLYSMLQIAATSYNTLAVLVIMIATYLIVLHFYAKEREGLKDNKPYIINDEKRLEVINQYHALAYDSALLIIAIGAILLVSFLFSTTFQSTIILASIIGILISIIIFNTFLSDAEKLNTRCYVRIRDSHAKRVNSKDPKKKKKVTDDGPQESVIIGIND